ncbi:MAG: glutathione S-transferase family protein [Hyphomonas sp.]
MIQPKLYFAPGACSRVPLAMLEKTRERFDTELIVFMRGDHRAPSFLSLNPSGRIPLLQIGDAAISQNPAILLWLHQRYPDANILPKAETDLESSLLLGRLLRFSADIHPLVTRIRMPQFFCDIEGAPARVAQMAQKSIRDQLADYETTLSDQHWLEGDDWSALDAYLHWVWFRITGAGFSPDAFPAIAAHYRRTLDIPAFQRAVAHETEAQSWLDKNGFAVKFSDT